MPEAFPNQERTGSEKMSAESIFGIAGSRLRANVFDGDPRNTGPEISLRAPPSTARMEPYAEFQKSLSARPASCSNTPHRFCTNLYEQTPGSPNGSAWLLSEPPRTALSGRRDGLHSAYYGCQMSAIFDSACCKLPGI